MLLLVPAATILVPSVLVPIHIQETVLGEPVSAQVEPSLVLTRILCPTVDLVNANIFEPSGCHQNVIGGCGGFSPCRSPVGAGPDEVAAGTNHLGSVC